MLILVVAGTKFKSGNHGEKLPKNKLKYTTPNNLRSYSFEGLVVFVHRKIANV